MSSHIQLSPGAKIYSLFLQSFFFSLSHSQINTQASDRRDLYRQGITKTYRSKSKNDYVQNGPWIFTALTTVIICISTLKDDQC